tara:strand:- start:2687 stop:3214 length:528 start_codon:yes stop_codon:yes gene_type:complete
MKKILLAVLVSLGLQTQAQQSNPAYFCCDSITYWTDQGQGFSIGLDTSGIVHSPDSIEVWWSVCTNGLCYSGDGMYDYFPQVTTSDTLKVGYDVYLYENNVAEVCSMEEWLIFDQNSFSWVLLNMIPTGLPGFVIEEDGVRWWNNIVYDMLGREVTEVETGIMYIRGGKKYIIVR